MKPISIVAGVASSLLLLPQAIAFDCYLTAMKGGCWENYDVTIKILKHGSEQDQGEVTIPKGKLWSRQKFSCEAQEGLDFKASFSPAVWGNDDKKTYDAKRVWYLPYAPKKGAVAWNMNICFHADFSSVPLPTDASTECLCDIESQIPPLPEVKQ